MNRMSGKCETTESRGEAPPIGGAELSANGHAALRARVTADPRHQFREYILVGAKPRARWRCGAELELLGFTHGDLVRLDHEQIAFVIEALASDPSNLTTDGGVLAGAQLAEGGNLTVEPGGQLEYSSAPHFSLVQIERELQSYLGRLRTIAQGKDFQFLAIGFDPLRTTAEQDWFPKPRYDIMRPYMAQRGSRAWNMMLQTCATQVSLDFASAEDGLRKYVIGNRLAPYVTAIFANSPFADGKPSGYRSTRAWTWTETDPDRCGLPPLIWNKEFTLDDFVEYALDVPMLFRRVDGVYLDDVTGTPFRQLLATQLDSDALVADWADHLTTIFTEARIKQVIELRSADCGGLPLVMAVQALWKGLLYDDDCLSQVEQLLPELSPAAVQEFQLAVAVDGLNARTAAAAALPIAKELVRLATEGLQRIAPDEVRYLDILHQQVIEDEVCPADILLRNWHGSWHGSMERVFEYVRAA
jgi:glutamate--cysteine ligase